jgi:uncharacterized peroxidase-related enzyme
MSTKIEPLTLADAPEAAAPTLKSLAAALGWVPNLYATVARAPHTLRGLLDWERHVARGSLSAREIELLKIHVSEINGCAYCLSAHSELGRRAGLRPDELRAARLGYGATPREDALLALARRIVRTGGSGARGELARAREAGISDAELFDVIAVVALKAFTNAAAILTEAEIDFPLVDHPPRT